MRGGDNPRPLIVPAPPKNSSGSAQYQPFLEHYAQLASAIHADVFCIGVRTRKNVGPTSAWRNLIARAREI